jgi:predicted ATP-dependent serine protease
MTEVLLSPKWKSILGHVPADEQDTVHLAGPSGTGKSTLCLQLADEFSRLGRVLYVCAEERTMTGTIRLRARLLKIFSQRIMMHDTKNLDEEKREFSSGQYKFCIVDSIHEMDAGDTEHMATIGDYPKVVFVFVAQVDWTEKMSRGSSSWRHAVDIRLWTEVNDEDNSRWAVNIKNRYAPAQHRMFLFKPTSSNSDDHKKKTAVQSYHSEKAKLAERGRKVWSTSRR